MRMHQSSPAMSFVDNEGFPKGSVHRERLFIYPQKDAENGELVTNEVIILRRQFEQRSPPQNSFINGREIIQILFPLVKEHQRFGSFRRQNAYEGSTFRVQDAIWAHGSLKLRQDNMVYRQGFYESANHNLQKCVYLEKGVPVTSFMRPNDPNMFMDAGLPSVYKRKQLFRVPTEILPANHNEKPARKPHVVCVNIWEEFMFGKNIMNRYTNGEGDPGIAERIRRYFNCLFPLFIINYLLYTLYFLVLFFSCFTYNMWWELGFYILMASHLQIHSEAYEKNIEVDFNGSLFQGPAYVCVRNWCEHCLQKDRQKLMFKLMKKMKLDITGT